ncbi:MAG: hypothetical protein OXI24_16550 [Candidatus Poribacteria bacterium]|nr:hypothetical protein [Candidatus Poribacteria bacterium]
MNDIPKFSSVMQAFIEHALNANAPIGKIIDDIVEIYPDFQAAAADKNARDLLYDRIKKIKTRLPEPDVQKEVWETIPHYLSAEWRLAYFRALLNATDDTATKIRLLREIRAEVSMIDKQNTAEEPKRKKAYERAQNRKIMMNIRIRDRAYAEAERKGWIHPGTSFPINAYEKISEDAFRRICDGVIVDKSGEPQREDETCHEMWMERIDGQLKDGEVYNYAPTDNTQNGSEI